MDEKTRIYEYWLAGISSLSDRKKIWLQTEYKSAEAVYYIEETELCRLDILTEKDRKVLRDRRRETRKNMKETWEKLVQEGIWFLTCFDERYPKRLKKIEDPPYALYGKGRLPDEESLSAAIVGARGCTVYGERLALEYGKILAQNGVAVISGLARGIDGAGQRGALNGGGYTCGVLGCGVDICYPREHIGLYMDIQKAGGLVSEFPPGRKPFSSNFPRRNRIISGLADVVLVMESQKKSGSLITADLALEQGKDVYALPGPVNSPLSEGCNLLIRQGAGILLSPEDLLKELGIQNKRLGKKSDKNEIMLESPENIVYSCLGLYPEGMDQLAAETGLAIPELLRTLVSLQMKGLVTEVSRNYYVKTCCD